MTTSPNPYEPPRIFEQDKAPVAAEGKPHRWVRKYLVVHLLLVIAGSAATILDSQGGPSSPLSLVLGVGFLGLLLMGYASPVLMVWLALKGFRQHSLWLALLAEAAMFGVSMLALLPAVQ